MAAPLPSYQSSAILAADGAVCTGKGVLHTVTISQNDAAPTAGTISVLDSTAAGAGTALFTWVLTTAVFIPFTITLDVRFSTGLYIDFTTTGDVNVVCSFEMGTGQ